MKINIEIDYDDRKAAVLSNILSERGDTIGQLFTRLAQQSCSQQADEWVADSVRTKVAAADPVDLMAALDTVAAANKVPTP